MENQMFHKTGLELSFTTPMHMTTYYLEHEAVQFNLMYKSVFGKNSRNGYVHADPGCVEISGPTYKASNTLRGFVKRNVSIANLMGMVADNKFHTGGGLHVNVSLQKLPGDSSAPLAHPDDAYITTSGGLYRLFDRFPTLSLAWAHPALDHSCFSQGIHSPFNWRWNYTFGERYVEFRFFRASTDVDHIMKAVKFAHMLVDYNPRGKLLGRKPKRLFKMTRKGLLKNLEEAAAFLGFEIEPFMIESLNTRYDYFVAHEKWVQETVEATGNSQYHIRKRHFMGKF